MKLSRRNTLLGLGTLAGGIGIIGGTGAFDTVQADRDFDVEVDGDAEALLQLVEMDEEYVQMGGEDNEILEISIGADEDESGISDEAITQFNDLFAVGNNGTEDVDVWFETEEVDGVEFYDSTYDGDSDSVTGPDNAQDVSVGDVYDEPEEADLVVGLSVDTRSNSDETYSPTDDPGTITVHADSNQN